MELTRAARMSPALSCVCVKRGTLATEGTAQVMKLDTYFHNEVYFSVKVSYVCNANINSLILEIRYSHASNARSEGKRFFSHYHSFFLWC